MPEETKEGLAITLRINGKKTKVGVQPLRVVVVDDKCDEKAVSSEQKGSCDGSEEGKPA